MIKQEVREEILKMAREGVSVQGIMSEVEISLPTIYKILAEGGVVPTSDSPQKHTPDWSLVLDAYFKGDKLYDIQERFKVHPAAVYAELRKRGIEKRGRAIGDIDLAITMYKDGAKLNDLIAATGVSTPKLYMELRLRKVARRSIDWRVADPPVSEAVQ
jgi:hypothetical protein